MNHISQANRFRKGFIRQARPYNKEKAFTAISASKAANAVLGLMVLLMLLGASPSTMAIGWPGNTLEGNPCTGLGQGYGPYDYTNPKSVAEHLPIVEEHHFTQKVQQLQGGESGRLTSDLDYTLRAFPNHHKALYAVVRYFFLKRSEHLITPPECYFQRALVFRPKDPVTHMLYGIYLQRRHKYKMALGQYKTSEKLSPRSAETHYNAGLLYFAMKRYDDAREEAKKAYRLGFPLSGLRNMLKGIGKWDKVTENK